MKYLISVLLVLSLAAHAEEKAPEKFAPKTKSRRMEEKISGYIFDKPLYDTSGGTDKKQTCIGVNVYLWRASLEAVSFLPKEHLDPFSGVITTQWHSLPEAPKDQLRVEISILSQQLRSDGVRVVLFKRTKDTTGNWKSVNVDPETVEKFEEAILTKARVLRVAEERK